MVCALYFGSFNPLHKGHVAIIKSLIESKEIDSVTVVVSPKNPLKNGESTNEAKNRLEHVRSRLAELTPEANVSDIEFFMDRPLYTINTLKKFKQAEPLNEYILVIGADNLSIIEKWNSYREILDNFRVWVYPRPGFDIKGLCKKYGATPIEAPLYDISSTEIRESKAKGCDTTDLIA